MRGENHSETGIKPMNQRETAWCLLTVYVAVLQASKLLISEGTEGTEKTKLTGPQHKLTQEKSPRLTRAFRSFAPQPFRGPPCLRRGLLSLRRGLRLWRGLLMWSCRFSASSCEHGHFPRKGAVRGIQERPYDGAGEKRRPALVCEAPGPYSRGPV